ncbi:ATP-binding protein [Fibrella sp. HMF5335]|uniref:ATP-binding protein n=1 Tax=Fibrella rubiginis TaxID=2817060 RepID=A0A939GLB3_9BACT|nr:ATP-binding protein [Fibrella rubiginis]MBO0938493.1 ATP-binding protein [Fibrella rubiginis]
MLTICLYGPESVGKTTLARELADHYQTVYVPEVARDLITSNHLTSDDYARIAVAQAEAMRAAAPLANRVLICDTDLLTTQLYATVYGVVHPPILDQLAAQEHFNAYFLLNTDVPWVADGLRDLGHRRAELFALFEQALRERGRAYTLVSGADYAQRRALVMNEIDKLLAQSLSESNSTS